MIRSHDFTVKIFSSAGVGNKYFRRSWWFWLFLALMGCNPRSSPDYLMTEYLERLSRVTGQPLPLKPHSPVPQLPELKLRQYPMAETRIKALDALDLLSCPALSQLVANRNSSLGKQLLPSQRLHYEKNVLAEITDCIHYLSNSNQKPSTAAILKQVAEEKIALLPAARWNMLFANTELAKQLNDSSNLLSLSDDDGRQGTLEALHYLPRYILDNSLEPPYTRQNLEQHLQQLYASRYSGHLLSSAVRLISTLNRAAQVLETWLSRTEICSGGKAPIEVERLENVFRLFYSGEHGKGVQPFLARVHQQGKEWRQRMLILMQQLPPPPSPIMRDYLERILSESSPSSTWTLLEQAVARHTKAWQTLLGRCERMPGQETLTKQPQPWTK